MKKNLLFLTVLASTILIANLVFAWTSPTTDPPGGNLPAPLNVGSDTQTKSGGLNIQGNVGIGTTSPGYKLDVSGDIRSTGTVRAGKGNFGFAPNGNGWTGFDLRGTGKRIILGVDDNSGNNVFDIEKVDSGWTHMMELWKNGGAYFAGNVGIGTTNPGAKLEVTAGSAVTTGIKTEGYIEDVSGNVSKNYTSSHSWTAGTTGSIGIFGQNGSTSENSRVWGMGPRGNRVILWKAVGDTTSGPDGGWNTSLFTIDNTKMYRFSVWIKKSVTTDGTTYFGTGGSPSVLKTLSGDDNSNPYFWYGDLPQLDRWYLLVGYIHAYDDTDTTNYGGIYDGITGKKVAGTTDYKFASGTTQTRHRTYLYYSTSGTATQYWWDPRVEEVNGSEPTIESLLGLYKPATQGSDAYFGGNVGIGTTSPGSKLEVNGDVKATAFYYSSDRRLKTNIKPLACSLAKIEKLSGVSFNWKKNGEKSIGLIAQDVEKIFPELVKTDKTSGMKSVQYAQLVAPLIEAVKEQQTMINNQKEMLNKQQEEINQLRAEIIH